LWLLELTEEGEERFGWDSADGFVVRAESEEEARKIAGENAGLEEWDFEKNEPVDRGPEFWGDPKMTTCVRVGNEGERGVVLESYRAG
jgi:hypothetical protein